eukprot:COSAG05_NODE_21938_length_268_cov_0.615385_1_plen_54_part_10
MGSKWAPFRAVVAGSKKNRVVPGKKYLSEPPLLGLAAAEGAAAGADRDWCSKIR